LSQIGLRAPVRLTNGTSLDVNSVLATSSASLATSVPCRPAVAQPLKGPKMPSPGGAGGWGLPPSETQATVAKRLALKLVPFVFSTNGTYFLLTPFAILRLTSARGSVS